MRLFSRYINKTAPVSKEVGESIQNSMRELDFIPNSAARKLATNQIFHSRPFCYPIWKAIFSRF